MPNFVNFVVTNAINSKEQYCCTPAGVSNLLKISTVVDCILHIKRNGFKLVKNFYCCRFITLSCNYFNGKSLFKLDYF